MKRYIYTICTIAIATIMTGCSIFQNNTTTVSGSDATITERTPVETTEKRVEQSKDTESEKKQTQTPQRHHSPQKPSLTLSEQILDGEWTIAEVNGRKVTGEERPYLTFSTSEGRIYGSNGCNIINGSYSVGDDSMVTFGDLITTQRACADAPFEYEINQALDKVATYSINKKGNEYYLSLLDKNKHRIMTLRKHNMDFLNGAWQVKNIKGKKIENENIQLVIDIPELKIHGNTGCNILNGSLWIDPDKTYSIQFQQIASTRMRCDEAIMKIETALLVALEEVESARKDDGKVKMYDKEGNKILELTSISD